MTTLIGIRTNSGLDGIVLAADYQITSFRNGEEVSRRRDKKLHSGEHWTMGSAGIQNKEVNKFFGVLKGHRNYGSSPEKARKIVEEAVRNKDFREILLLNKILRKSGVEIEDLPAFLLAVNKPKLSLWKIDEYGNFRNPEDDNEFDYICLGSGEDRVNNYIQSQLEDQRIDREQITMRVALKIARDTMYIAERDPETGMGYGLIILTDDGIKSWGEEIRDEIKKAEERKVEAIATHYEHN